MNGLWNNSDLKRPPLLTVDVPNAKFVESLHQAITLCTRNQQEDCMEFAQTAAILSRLIARRKNSFRRMIGFRNLLKLNSATCRLLRADLPRDIELFCGALPDIVYGDEATATLPTKNCVDFLLIRLLCVYHIHHRIHDCTVTAAEHFLELLRANNFVDISTLLLAVLAKLRCLNAQIGNRYVDLYHKLLKYRDRFPKTKSKNILLNSAPLPEKIDKFQLPILDTEEENTNLLQTVKIDFPSVGIKTEISKLTKRTDIGTELKRRVEKVKTPQGKFKVDELKTTEDVKRFITAENKARKESTKSSISHRIPNNLWVGAQKIFERRLQGGDSKKALRVFLKFLSTNL